MKQKIRTHILRLALMLAVVIFALPSLSFGSCKTEEIIIHNEYLGACGYTDISTFTLDKDTYITRIRIWYDSYISGDTLSATLSGPDGYTNSSGEIYKDGCYGNWCAAMFNINKVLKAGTYTLKADSKSVCSNPSGATTLILYGCDAEEQLPDDSAEGINPPNGISMVDANANPNNAPVYMGNIVSSGGVSTLSGNMELSVNFPAYNKPVDIWILISLPDGRFYTANESGKLLSFESGDLAAIASGVSGTKTEKKILTPFEIGESNTAFEPWPADGAWNVYWLVAPESSGNIYGAIENGHYELGFYSFEVKSQSGDITYDLKITEYFPQSGPAGSYVFLKLEKPVSDLGNLAIIYNSKELNPNTVIKKNENILQFVLPADAQSGKIQIKSGDEVSNTVQFSILPPVSTPLISQSIEPSSVNQIINYKDEVSVTIPPGIIDSTATLKISAVNNAPPSGFEPFGSNAIDISIDGLKQLNDFIKISVKYDPNRLNSNYSAEEQLMAMRWNDEEQYWTPLPYSVDEVNNTVNIMTDHLCFFAIPPLASVASTLAITGLAGANIAVWTGIGEELENDIYFTPEGNFKLMYSKSGIESDAKLNDITWIGETYNDPLYQRSSYKTAHPKFIQDIGNLLEVALKNYVDVNKFKNPVTKPGWLWGTSTNPIIVKIDSRWTKQYAQSEANYEAIWGYIHYPTEVLKAFKDGLSYGVIGHELFHRIEAEYYTLVGYEMPANNWWLESASDYAGYRVAWADKKKIEKEYNDSKADFLSYPISTFEYSPSAFIQFLVEKKGLNFADMFKFVSEGSPLTTPLEKLKDYNGGISIPQYYRDFTAWSIFGNDSYLSKYSIPTIAEENTNLNIPKDATATISFTGGNFSTISIYKFTGEYQRVSNIPTPERLIGKEDKYEVKVNTGDVFYLVADNSGKENESLYTYISISVNGIEKANAAHTFNLQGGYSAKLWIIKSEMDDCYLKEDMFFNSYNASIRVNFKDCSDRYGIQWDIPLCFQLGPNGTIIPDDYCYQGENEYSQKSLTGSWSCNSIDLSFTTSGNTKMDPPFMSCWGPCVDVNANFTGTATITADSSGKFTYTGSGNVSETYTYTKSCCPTYGDGTKTCEKPFSSQ
ncbi:MAG: hypothetical protein HQK72_03250 [Desulfamplus sp.]|nr:hypothetical protein [Desulfamplus sp.]